MFHVIKETERLIFLNFRFSISHFNNYFLIL